MYLITPSLRTVALLVKFLQPVSHHDPAQRDSSNRNLFHRQKALVERHVVTADVEVSDLLALFPVPESLSRIFSSLSEAEALAVALVYQFIVAYGSADGMGLFSGPERYRRLEERAAQWAVRSASIFRWWGGMAHDLQVGLPLYGDGTVQTSLFGMPTPVALSVLKTLAENATSAVMLARVWREEMRHEHPVLVPLTPQQTLYQTSQIVTLDVPAISANSLRHEMVREPGALHLLNALDLTFDELPAAVATVLYNAGDLKESAPEDAFKLAREIRARYPLLGLLGAAMDGFILGASNVEVSAWLVAVENAAALARYGIKPELSLFDLLDEAQHTRHTNKRVEGSPMPFSFETLATGTEALIEFRLRPYATQLEAGALLAALQTYLGADSTLFGQSARGYGLVEAHWLATLDDGEALANYEQYLANNYHELRAGLLDGKLGTGRVILS